MGARSPTFTVAITGHRPNRLGIGVARVARRLELALTALRAGSSGHRRVAVSALAEGADRLFAEAALTLGYELHALLPFESADYEVTFDDPGTTAHENVSGSGGMYQTRIHDDFDEEIPPVTAPVWGVVSGNPAGNTNFATGNSPATPTRYIISGNLGAFAVTAPAAGSTGYVEILVNGNLNIGNGGGAQIVIPPNVYATLYVDGNIDFGNGDVNANAASSKVATHLTVYGVHATGTYSASGNGTNILTFYGPNYDATLSGTITTMGSIVSKSFDINGGGNGGFHYDEALGRTGDVAGWTIVSYFDDARTDL